MSALESACCELQHNKTRQQHLLVSFVQPVWCCKGIFVAKPTHSFVACPTENKDMEWSLALANRTLDEAAAAGSLLLPGLVCFCGVIGFLEFIPLTIADSDHAQRHQRRRNYKDQNPAFKRLDHACAR